MRARDTDIRPDVPMPHHPSPFSLLNMPARNNSPVFTTKLKRALRYIADVNSYPSASIKFGVPRSTLAHLVKVPISKAGCKLAFTSHEKGLIGDMLHQFANHGTPLSRMHLVDTIEIMIRHMETARRLFLPFRNERPGARFLRDFRK